MATGRKNTAWKWEIKMIFIFQRMQRSLAKKLEKGNKNSQQASEEHSPGDILTSGLWLPELWGSKLLF